MNSKNPAYHELTDLQKILVNDFQKYFPLSPTPYADIATQLGVTEAEVLSTLHDLNEKGIISRIGPVFRPHCIGTSTLATMAVPNHQLKQIASYISSLSEVNHNYEREHHFNLWFVITASTQEHLEAVLAKIEKYSKISVISLPMLESYHIDLGFNLKETANL